MFPATILKSPSVAKVPKSLSAAGYRTQITSCRLRPSPFLFHISACVPPLFKGNVFRLVTMEPVRRDKFECYCWHCFDRLLPPKPLLIVIWRLASFWCAAFLFSWKCACFSGLLLYLFLLPSCYCSPCVSSHCFGLFWYCSSSHIFATQTTLPFTVLLFFVLPLFDLLGIN